MKKIGLILAVLCLVPIASAEILFELDIYNNFEGVSYTGRFIPQINTEATNEYDPRWDVMMAPAPPSGTVINIGSLVYSERFGRTFYLMRDSRPDEKKQEFDILIAGIGGYIPYLYGTNTLSWDSSSIPDNYKVRLFDYGLDSARKDVIETVDMNRVDSYSFELNGEVGRLRYLKLRLIRKGSKLLGL